MSKTLYLVTGAMGYLGNTIISKLAAQGKLIRGLALPNDNTISYTQPNVEIVHGDVRDKDSLTSFFSHNPDTELIVIHTAAIVSISSKVDKKVVDVNVNGTKNIVELCLRHKVKNWFIPVLFMPFLKNLMEKPLRKFLNLTPNRYMVCMPKQKLLPLKLY